MKTVSVATMRSLDEAAISSGVPAEVLMENAGVGAYREMRRFLDARVASHHRSRFAVVAGKGNNGGDAHVVAQCLARAGDAGVAVYSVCDRAQLRGAARVHAERVPAGVPFHVCAELPAQALAPGTVLVDGLLGTGVSGPLLEPYSTLVRQINASALPVVALDVPSGLDADTGAVASEAVVADLTVTMGLPKRGLLTPEGLARCGSLRCVDIGIPTALVAAAEGVGEATFGPDVAAWLSRRARDSHKGTFGHLLVVGGSSLYAGAPLLAGTGALRSGAGLVTVAVPEQVRAGLGLPLQALIVRGLADAGAGSLSSACHDQLEVLLERAEAVAFGPGVGRQAASADVLRQVLACPLPLVVDADGLHLLAQHAAGVRRPAPTVLTPHPGEMRVLLEGYGLTELQTASRSDQASGLARKTGFYVVLKGMGSVVAAPDGRWAVNTSGSSGLASAGSGDVLTGVLGGLLAQGLAPWDAARLGVFVHGFCAEIAGCGDRALVADDLVALLGVAWRELTPFA